MYGKVLRLLKLEPFKTRSQIAKRKITILNSGDILTKVVWIQWGKRALIPKKRDVASDC